MYQALKATQVTPGGDEATTLRWLAERYAYPDPDAARSPIVRANMVTSIDGAACLDGKSGGLGGTGDQRLFRVLRSLCDVVFVGARTAITEGYRQPSPDDILVGDRIDRGQAAAPALALVSNSLSIPTDYAPLSSPDTVVLTCLSAAEDKRDALADIGATIVDCGDESVDMASAVAACAARGWHRILNEGGPSILGACIDAGLVDEMCVTTSPNLIAGDSGRIAHHDATPSLHTMTPSVIITDDDGYVFTRWVRA